ncbi:MAG: putative reverse transcriptase, partial [Streblomastix strix]
MTQLKQSLPLLIQEYPIKRLLKGFVIVKWRSNARDTAMNHQKIPQHMIMDHVARMGQESAVNILQNMARGHTELEVNPNNQMIEIRDLQKTYNERKTQMDQGSIRQIKDLNQNSQANQQKVHPKWEMDLMESMVLIKANQSSIQTNKQEHQSQQGIQTTQIQPGIVQLNQSHSSLDNHRTQILIGKQGLVPDQRISNQLPSQQREFAVGGRLVHFLEEWKKIKADVLIEKGIKANWIHQECPRILEENKYIPQQMRFGESVIALEELILKELREEIIEEVQKKDLRWINPCFAIPKSENGQWRKITDCSILNKFLLSSHFIIEDITTLRQTLQPNDWMIKVDLESAFHHIKVDKEFRPFLGFHFNGHFYQYKAMCFGVKHAPLVFYKTLHLAIQLIREQIRIRRISYFDDLIFLLQSSEDLECKKIEILQILKQFEKNKDDKSNKKMEQDCPKDDEREGKRTGKLHRSIKLLEALDTKRWPSYEEAEQGQTVCRFEQGLEQQSLLEQRYPLRDILVE